MSGEADRQLVAHPCGFLAEQENSMAEWSVAISARPVNWSRPYNSSMVACDVTEVRPRRPNCCHGRPVCKRYRVRKTLLYIRGFSVAA